MSKVNFSVYIGFDSREPLTYRVCQNSILRHSPASNPPKIYPVVQKALRAGGIYTRDPDIGASTEFSLTRFLVPYMAGYGSLGVDYAIFLDCDFVITEDIANVFKVLTPAIDSPDAPPVWVVKHPEYIPRRTKKMDGKTQASYPRKNWSSFMVFNLRHPTLRRLTPEYVNTALPRTLHRFEWVGGDAVGSIPGYWNHLVGEQTPRMLTPAGIHYTNGTLETLDKETFMEYDYADIFLKEVELL